MESLGHITPHFWRSFAVSGVVAHDVRLPMVHAKWNLQSYEKMVAACAHCANLTRPLDGRNGPDWCRPLP